MRGRPSFYRWGARPLALESGPVLTAATPPAPSQSLSPPFPLPCTSGAVLRPSPPPCSPWLVLAGLLMPFASTPSACPFLATPPGTEEEGQQGPHGPRPSQGCSLATPGWPCSAPGISRPVSSPSAQGDESLHPGGDARGPRQRAQSPGSARPGPRELPSGPESPVLYMYCLCMLSAKCQGAQHKTTAMAIIIISGGTLGAYGLDCSDGVCIYLQTQPL